MAQPQHPAEHHGSHETTDVTPRPVMIFGGVLALTVAGTLALIWALFQFYLAMPVREAGPVSPLTADRVPPPAPRLQTMETQFKDLIGTRTSDIETLNSYAWVDKNAGIVRIPIQRAMMLAIERGLPKPQQPAKPAGGK